MALARRLGNGGAEVRGAAQTHRRTITAKNRVAFINVNDPLAPAHHPRLILSPPPLHFRPVIYSSVSVICVLSQWESRMKERLQGWRGRERKKKKLGIGVQSWRSAEEPA